MIGIAYDLMRRLCKGGFLAARSDMWHSVVPWQVPRGRRTRPYNDVAKHDRLTFASTACESQQKDRGIDTISLEDFRR